MTNLQEDHAALQEAYLELKTLNANEMFQKDKTICDLQLQLTERDKAYAAVVSENEKLKADLAHERRVGLRSTFEQLHQQKKRLIASYSLNHDR